MLLHALPEVAETRKRHSTTQTHQPYNHPNNKANREKNRNQSGAANDKPYAPFNKPILPDAFPFEFS
jgi:hypothetical protein